MCFLWGLHITHVLECLFLGIQLKKVSNVRRIVYIAEDEVPLQAILTMYWEIRPFKHLELQRKPKSMGAASRLSRVYSKLLLWKLCDDVEVAVLLDSDIWVKENIDEILTTWSAAS